MVPLKLGSGVLLAAAGALVLVVGMLLGAPSARELSQETAEPSAAQSADEAPSPAGPQGQPGRPQAADNRLRVSTAGWKTDFSRHSVPLGEIISGGPPRDGIPPIDRPTFESVAQASAWLKPMEPVIHLAVGSDARAYPLQIMTWHEIANDEVGGTPATITFCPLCNTAIAFDRRVAGRTLDFGTSGNLRHSDLVMWDRQTESWWQQASGEAIVGELTGEHLTMLPAAIVSWDRFRDQFPAGRVLSRQTGHTRDYGRNPYVGYDRIDQSPFLFRGAIDARLQPMERVVTVSLGDEAIAYPFGVLRERRVVTDVAGGQRIVVFWEPGTASALDGAAIAASRDVGATGVFRAEANGLPLTVSWKDDAFVDEETGSRWTILGAATTGPLAGTQLEAVVHSNAFWFVWGAFTPETRIYR